MFTWLKITIDILDLLFYNEINLIIVSDEGNRREAF